MFIKAKIALCIAIVLSAAVSASAAVRSDKNAIHRGRLHAAAPRAPAAINSDDPAVTGGGSIGYNQNIYNW